VFFSYASFGFEARTLRHAEVREFEPAIESDVAGAVYFANSGSCSPQTFVVRLAEAAQRLGAAIRTHTPVNDAEIENGRIRSVVTDGGSIEADAFVFACGSWAPRLSRRLGVRLPVQPGKGYHLDVDRPVRCPRIPVVLMEELIFVSPIDDFLRMAGTMEFSGFNLYLRPERLNMLSVGAGRYFPEIPQARIRSQWCHLRPMTPDGLPIIGRAPQLSNAWIATGHGMLGLTQGPITGQLLAEWIVDGRTQMDLTPLRPDRF
jgi:D-amino-acid dehydrogenase